MSSEPEVDYTGRVAATGIPRTDKERFVLAAKRIDNGDWEFPGGKQEEGQSILYTAEREINEEFSIEIEPEEAEPGYSWTGGGHDIIPVDSTHGYNDLEKVIDEEKMTDHSEYVWLDTENLGTNLENAREKLGEEIKLLEAFDYI